MTSNPGRCLTSYLAFRDVFDYQFYNSKISYFLTNFLTVLDGLLAMSGELTSSLRSVILHPLVILQISEHWTRTKVNNTNKPLLGIIYFSNFFYCLN